MLEFSLSDLPDGTRPQLFFFDSSFFRDHGAKRKLPSPAEVRERSTFFESRELYDPAPVKFEHLNLIVKFGPRISTSEALCLWAVRKFLQNEVPVPELYGWDTDGQHVFIYMQLIQGHTLQERYETLNSKDKRSVCEDLRMFMGKLRSLRQKPQEQCIGSIAHGPLRDRILEGQENTGPFPNAKTFHDWMSWLWLRVAPEPEKVQDPYRNFLSDNGPILFTHGDLDRSNIIISTTSPARVLGIIDWEQAGWFPEYWEYCKAAYTVGEEEEWRAAGWIDSFLTAYLQEMDAWEFTVESIGGI